MANIRGFDSNWYQCAYTIEEGQREIMLELTNPYQDQTFQQAKRVGSAVTAITIPIDARTLTLSGGYFTEDDFPGGAEDQRRNDQDQVQRAEHRVRSVTCRSST